MVINAFEKEDNISVFLLTFLKENVISEKVCTDVLSKNLGEDFVHIEKILQIFLNLVCL